VISGSGSCPILQNQQFAYLMQLQILSSKTFCLLNSNSFVATAVAQITATLGIISQMVPREFKVRTTTDEFNV